jgi:thioredoxin-like negative regulator of GroEL
MVSIGTVGIQQRRNFGVQAVGVASSLVLALLSSTVAQAQKAGDFNGTGPGQPVTPGNVQIVSPSGGQGGLFSLEAAKRLLGEAQGAVSAQNYSAAASKFQETRQIANQLSNFYQALAGSFLGVDNRAADSLRLKALDSAQIRDQSTYQLALVYRAQNKPEQAIPLLIEIIRSQNPSRELGQKSYQQLFELGFVDVPYPRTGAPANPKQGSPKQDDPKQDSPKQDNPKQDSPKK